jgi:hypothetical protein
MMKPSFYSPVCWEHKKNQCSLKAITAEQSPGMTSLNARSATPSYVIVDRQEF